VPLPDLDMSGTSNHGTARHRNDCAGPGLNERCPRRSTSSRFCAGRWGLDTGWPRGSSPQRIPNSGRFRVTFCRDRTGRPTSWHNGRVIAAIRQRRRISTAFPRARLLARGGRSRFDSGQDCLDRRSFGRVLKLLNTVRGISIEMSDAFPSRSLIASPPADGALLYRGRSRALLLPDARLPPFGRRGAGNLSVQPRGERGHIVRAGRRRSAFEVEWRQSLSEPALGRSIRHNGL
jgi:hypothetical protein